MSVLQLCVDVDEVVAFDYSMSRGGTFAHIDQNQLFLGQSDPLTLDVEG